MKGIFSHHECGFFLLYRCTENEKNAYLCSVILIKYIPYEYDIFLQDSDNEHHRN